MERRDFLARSGVVLGLTALSGCTEETLVEAEREPVPFRDVEQEEYDLPVEQRLEVAEAAIEHAEGEELSSLEELESYLADAGIDLEKLSEAEKEGKPIVSLESVFEQSTERGFMHHLGLVAGGYAALVESDHESEKLEGTLLDTDSRLFGEYEIRRSWAVEFLEGELTAKEYAHEIAVSAESV